MKRPTPLPALNGGGERLQHGKSCATVDYGSTPMSEKMPPFEGKFQWWPLPRRYYVAIMAFFGFCNVYTMRVNLSMAILEMTKNETGKEPGEFAHWTSFDQGLILSAFFYGYIVTQLPGGFLASKVGGKLPFGVGIAGTAFFTLFTPLFAGWGKEMLITVRVIEGLFEGVAYPSIHAVWSHWAPPQEKTKLATLAFSGSYFGTVLAMPLSATLAENLGWRWVFYFFGVLASIWCVIWFLTVAETPSRDNRITSDELQYIQSSIGFSFEQVSHAGTPWVKIFTSMPVWAIVVAHSVENWGFYTMLTDLPRFVQDTTHARLEKTGFVAAVPYLVMGIIVQVGGHVADWLRQKKQISTVIVRKSFNCIGFLAQAAFIWTTAYTTSIAATISCVTLAIGIGGLAWSGFSVNHLDIAPQYAGILMGLSNSCATIPGMLSPVIVGSIVTNHSIAEWQVIFHIAAGIYLFGAAFYAIFASGSIQPWADLQGGYVAHLDELRQAIDGAEKKELD